MLGWMEVPRPWLFLAPMAGVADWPFRELCYRLGAEITVSRLVPVTGVVVSPSEVLPTLGAHHGAHPFIVQLLGNDPAQFREAARILTDALPISGIDINMGCPVAPVVSAASGSALLREPERAAAIVSATCAGTNLPVSVKLRAGWDSITAPDLATLLESAGARAIIIHGRTREQHYRGRANLEVIAAIKRTVSIPVVGNGDVVSVETARQMLDRTGVDGIMIGRGALGRPWLFAELQAGLKGNPSFELRRESSGELIREHARLTFADQGVKAALTIRKHLAAYARNKRTAGQLRRALESLASWHDVERWITAFELAALDPGSNKRTACA